MSIHKENGIGYRPAGSGDETVSSQPRMAPHLERLQKDHIDKPKDRWRELDLEQFESIFRFRLGDQKRRTWGFIVQAHFHMVWWDRNHSYAQQRQGNPPIYSPSICTA